MVLHVEMDELLGLGYFGVWRVPCPNIWQSGLTKAVPMVKYGQRHHRSTRQHRVENRLGLTLGVAQQEELR